MAHKFQKGAEDYACGQIELMLQRLEEHRQEHEGRLPAVFVLHPGSSERLNDEHYKRYGVPHNMQFAGVPIVLCRCVKYQPKAYPTDWMKTADDKLELL